MKNIYIHSDTNEKFVVCFLIKCNEDSKERLVTLKVHYDTLAANYNSHYKHNYLFHRAESLLKYF